MSYQLLAKYALLFFAPFLHEDLAIVAAGLLIVEHRLPIAFALASVYAGVVASDMTIFGLGVAARRLPGLRRILIGERARSAAERLQDHLALSVALCHLLPGALFPTFLACGWLGVPARRFALASMLAAAIYVPVALLLVVTLGSAVLRAVGWWSWAVVAAPVAILAFRGSLRRVWSGLASAWRRAHLAARERQGAMEVATHRGMPALGRLARKVASSERIPTVLFYAPLAARWITLGLRYGSLTLPTVANPKLEAGGLWGESKSALMRQIGPGLRHWVAAFITVDRGALSELDADLARALSAMAGASLHFPIVAKPDVGWQGYGVRLVANAAELRDYLARFPGHNRLLLQQLVDWDGEAGVYYARRPGEPTGRVVGLAFRYFPHVVGDGRSTLRELIAADERTSFKGHVHLGAVRDHLGVHSAELDTVPAAGRVVRLAFIGSIRAGGLYRDALSHLTQALSERFDTIARSMDEFYLGRFDIRFASVERLEAAEDFAIIEINGAGSEPIQIWDPDRTLAAAYRELARYQSLMFDIAQRNRSRGYRPMRLSDFLRWTWRYSRMLPSYPASS
jgi:membrane protein DedA with SNARE-associated domain